MGILVADSGSSKTDWIWSDGSESITFESPGLNPHYVSKELTENVLKNRVLTALGKKPVDALFFYGAGCAAEDPVEKLIQVFESYFHKAHISIEHDLLGAGRVLFGNGTGIAAILGTGSSCCLMEQGKITDRIPSLGFMIGDEGSAGYFGKIFLTQHFYKKWPEELELHFNKVFNQPVTEVLNQIYGMEMPNKYVASIAQILFEKKAHPYVQHLILEGFNEFIEKQMSGFSVKSKSAGFVGSLAYYNKELLEQALSKHGIELTKVIRKPIKSLLNYHLPS